MHNSEGSLVDRQVHREVKGGVGVGAGSGLGAVTELYQKLLDKDNIYKLGEQQFAKIKIIS